MLVSFPTCATYLIRGFLNVFPREVKSRIGQVGSALLRDGEAFHYLPLYGECCLLLKVIVELGQQEPAGYHIVFNHLTGEDIEPSCRVFPAVFEHAQDGFCADWFVCVTKLYHRWEDEAFGL